MKKIILYTAALSLTLGIYSCKGKKTEDTKATAENAEQKTVTTPTESKPQNAPKTYQITFDTDTCILGKDKIGYVKLLSGEAIELQDPDGKVTGLNIKFKLRGINKSTLSDKKFFSIYSSEARLESGNGTSVPARGDSLDPEPEASEDVEWTFAVPADAKPTKLNLFSDGTRVSVILTLK